jgi:hypothetical protein
MAQEFHADLETDARFPTGEWTGFWLQREQFAGRQKMDLSLTFALGKIRGTGRDVVGEFSMRGRYETANGKVVVHKDYVGKHHVLYEGWAESGKGIWGVWSIAGTGKDGFHLWPRGMRDPSQKEVAAEVREGAARGEERKTTLVESSKE